ncbi:hypothetical protein NDU88_002400 [Pleurodeles waltl]|uniref:Uncharacterized protein n=1 Tax=Pleurodeles waltl TaxID=8319 RepID=A0AAV7NFB7_PLEWA|nr:hypothetical protein NDU88_002400 [Pleurodeles waltl]
MGGSSREYREKQTRKGAELWPGENRKSGAAILKETRPQTRTDISPKCLRLSVTAEEVVMGPPGENSGELQGQLDEQGTLNSREARTTPQVRTTSPELNSQCTSGSNLHPDSA